MRLPMPTRFIALLVTLLAVAPMAPAGGFCGGWVKSFRYAGGLTVVDGHNWTSDLGKVGGLTSFGTDGSVYRLARG